MRTVAFAGWKLQYDLSNRGDFMQFQDVVRTGSYELATTRLLTDIIRPGDVFVDVGANIGYYSALALSRVGATGKVIAIEPNPDAYVRLQRNMVLNGAGSRLRMIQSALSDHHGRVKLRLFGDDDGLSSVVASTERNIPISSTRSIDVEASTFDSLFPAERVNVVKIDVEGAELAVLRGMRDTLLRNPSLNLVIEWNQWYRNLAFWEYLQGHFLTRRIIDVADGYKLVPLPEYGDTKYLPLSNLLCSPI